MYEGDGRGGGAGDETAKENYQLAAGGFQPAASSFVNENGQRLCWPFFLSSGPQAISRQQPAGSFSFAVN